MPVYCSYHTGMNSFQPKLAKNRWDGSLAQPQYSLAYSLNEKPATIMERSRVLRHQLLGDSTLLLELNSNLLAMTEREREPLVLAFREHLTELGLDYRHQTTPQTGKSSFFAKFLNGDIDAHQIMVLVEPATWQSDQFEEMLPKQGMRYYRLPSSDPGEGLLDAIFQGKLLRKELIERFDLIVYDVAIFGQMGIISARRSYEELQGLISL